MGDPKGFVKIKRQESGYRPVEERIRDYGEVEMQLPDDARIQQASRCMDCGVPFCHWSCPVENIMPEFQDKVYKREWEEAYAILQETNNFPEFTGRVCPALCEPSCVLSINSEPVTIRQNELAIIEKAFQLGLVKPEPPEKRTSKKVAVVGGGPAGLACADLLNKAGHSVVLYESEEHVGGYLRYGIPDFKLDKKIIERRVNILTEEGLVIKTGVKVGRDIETSKLADDYDALCICIGAREPRALSVEGNGLKGIHYAIEYLSQQNNIVSGKLIPKEELIIALDKNVIVIGGGDTGSDCVGTANRQGARSVTQIELLPKPPENRSENEPWPLWPKILKTSSSHEEGCVRLWNMQTTKIIGENGKVKKLLAEKVIWEKNAAGGMLMKEIPNSEIDLDADLILLAMGFVHVVHEGFVKELGLALDERGNIRIDGMNMTSRKGIFAAGDSHRGASLIVWAIQEGRKAAFAINEYLKNL